MDAFAERMELRFEILEARIGERLESSLKDIQKEFRVQDNRFLGWLFATAGTSLAIAGFLSRIG